MTTTATPASASSAPPLQPDLERVIDFVNEIRIAYTPTDSRQPLSFDRHERRGSARIPLQVPIRLTPVELIDGFVCLDEHVAQSINGLTRDLSLRGVGFTHAEPFPHKYAAVTFDVPTHCPLSLVVEIHWTRERGGAKHRSGAKFLALMETPEALR
ncbi:MAG: PilZ domain-containing protein [Planctomycetaceae bacterium]